MSHVKICEMLNNMLNIKKLNRRTMDKVVKKSLAIKNLELASVCVCFCVSVCVTPSGISRIPLIENLKLEFPGHIRLCRGHFKHLSDSHFHGKIDIKVRFLTFIIVSKPIGH